MEYGVVVYDVPVTRKGVYNRLRTKLKRLTIQMTWSVYLTPFENRDVVLGILRDLDEDEDAKDRIMYKFIKFDASEQDQLDALVKERFDAHLVAVKDTLDQALGEATVAYEVDEKISTGDWALMRRAACTKAKKKLNEARRLSLVFEVTGVMETAFGALDALIESKREAVKDKLKEEREAAKEEAKAAKKAAKEAAKEEAAEVTA